MIKDMLKKRSNAIYLIVLLCFLGCSKKKPNYKKLRLLFTNKSISIVSKDTYFEVLNKANDSVRMWASNSHAGYLNERDDVWYIDSLVCFNNDADKCVMALVKQNNIYKEVEADGMTYFYGVKIKEEWYFFSGPYIVLPREYYQKDLHTPLSFEKLHEIAMKEIFWGYLKKNELGEWEINERFFDAFSKVWVPFEERKTMDCRFFSCENFDNEKDYWDCTYRKHAERKWVKEKWFLANDAPIYNSIDPMEVQWTLKKGTQVSVFEYVDGGIWCSMRAEGYMPNGLSDGKTRYVRRSDLTETDPHAPKVAKSSIKEAQRSP